MFGFSLIGIVVICLFVTKINTLLNTDLGFDKDSVYSVLAKESSIILPDTFIFSSEIPGFRVKKQIEVQRKNNEELNKIALQYISNSYFDFFNYDLLVENRTVFDDPENTQMVYLNESAVHELGFENVENSLGARLENGYKDFVICGVVKNKNSLTVSNKKQAIIFQVNSAHLAYAFFTEPLKEEFLSEEEINVLVANSFQRKIESRFKIMEDIIYSIFLCVNILISIICLSWIGSKYANKNEQAFYTILSVGVNVFTLIISKTYIYILAILGFVAGPLSFLTYKFWIGMYENKIGFKTLDLFIFFSISLLTIYLIACPKTKINKILKIEPSI
jgi:hypothetical protein